MLKKNDAIPRWAWLAWILVMVLGIAAYIRFPAQVVGVSHRVTPRLLVVLYEPTIMLFVILLWHVLWRIDPRKRNYELFWPTYRYIGGVIVVSIGLIYLTVLGHFFNITSIRFVPTIVGIMFMLIANVLPRIRPNWSIGFRTPWTLSSTESWNRTHRLGGQLGIAMGLLVILLAWVLPTNAVLRLAIAVPIFLWVLITVVASYFYANRKYD